MPPPNLISGKAPSYGPGRRILSSNSRKGGHTDFHEGYTVNCAAQFSSPSPPSPVRPMVSRQLTLPLRGGFTEVREPTFAMISSAGFTEAHRSDFIELVFLK